jgi:hypothetical protein
MVDGQQDCVRGRNIMRLPQRFIRTILASFAMLSALCVFPVLAPHTAPAFAQRATVSAEFRAALEPYGEFRSHRRWGAVWVPAQVGRDWRPYTVGRWVYSDDYGWYWASADEEEEWGWIVYHYGRWTWDDELGWCWVPGREWAPAWVEWRRGSRHIGWAPLPPDEVIVEVREDPRFWIFVEPRHFVNLRIHEVTLRPEPVFFRNTLVVNETVYVRERNFAVNPGIAPQIVAAAVGRPIRAFDVRPRILAGTADIRGAIQVRTEDLRREEFRRSIVREREVRQSATVFNPAPSVPAPQALKPNERGRLGDTPPRAASGTTGAAPQERQPPTGTAPGLRERERAPDTTAAPDRAPPSLRERDRPPSLREGDRERGTTGVAPGLRERDRERGTTGVAPERPSGPPSMRERERERGTKGPAGLRERERDTTGPGLRERKRERGTTGVAPERPSGPPPGLRERGPDRPSGPPPGARERGPDRDSLGTPAMRGPDRGAMGAPPDRPAGPPAGLRERGPERGTVGAAPSRERSGPPAMRGPERGPSVAPERPSRPPGLGEGGGRERGGRD